MTHFTRGAGLVNARCKPLDQSSKRWSAARFESVIDKAYIGIVRLLLESAPASPRCTWTTRNHHLYLAKRNQT